MQLSASDKAIIARKVRAAFDNGEMHASTWGRAYYVGIDCPSGNEGATMLIMNTLTAAGVFADED